MRKGCELYMLSEQDKAFVLNIKYDDISYELIEGTFCNHYNPQTKKMEKPRISPEDEDVCRRP